MTQTAPASWRGVSQASRATSTGKSRPSSSSARSKSQPKQRNAKPKPPSKPTPSAFELGVEQARTYADSATPEQLETRLQQLLLAAKFTDAAFLIAASAHLSTRFQTADVVRLMLEQAKSPRALDQAAQLVRDLQLQQNDALVTLLINEMVRAMQFGAAMRLAQEMVPGFETLSAAADRPCWTPSALIQAMIRAGKFRAALKFSKQFGLLETFPAPQLVRGMLETRSYEEAISSVMEMQLFKDFPLEALAVEMMKQRQWAQAVKCMNKLSDKDDTRAKFYEALVRETAHVGDFVTSLRYLREFKLDQGNGDATISLLRYLVDAMVAHNEFYKAIKYAIKFNLAKNPLNDAIAAAEAALAAASGEEFPLKEEDNTEYLPQYNVELLIRKAIEGGQFHVATTYIKKLRLREKFADELVAIEKAQHNRLLEFRQYAQLRLAQFQDPAFQKNLYALLGDQAEDEMIELEPVEVEIVLSEEEEIIPRKKKAQHDDEDEDVPKESEKKESTPVAESSKPVEDQQQSSVPAETTGQSRFGFARAPASSQPPLPSVPDTAEGISGEDNQPRSKSAPPSRSPPPPGLSNPSDSEQTQVSTQESAGSFNFADFAKSVQVSGPPPPPYSAPSSQPLQQPPQPPQPPQQQPFLNQQQQTQAMFGRPMPPMPNNQFAGGPPGYPMPPMMPQQNPMYFRGNMPPGVMQPPGYPQPPPPPPSNNGGGALDVASLAMQFHNTGSNGSSGLGGFGGPRPPMSYPGASPNGQHFPGMPPFGVPPPPPQSTFKPSMSYTSVTTTRQKK
ncbi:hypothetical protein F442_15726 [Phytophthora nicotianae P10297]|uniref:Uncharacterized protein n=4 Tax=Phytophthora nicotianae TaxID=4792 RepID=V9EHE0_PHYNI|nr:hypothetical protein F443_15885 [Phytophthora nicotianae P1569]ETL85250.1 hypothetical protein L917_15160 [Phytophthora nicotianae]ETM38401.1 hypothetical protein L914_15299 [Phytophthora nicotianae]ETO67155.1 hypothetical protein F444_15866 [Phytophthora nicotianae P1976]ETP36319.1 hypothetical protein F442_15726 [Phytophthora nicotianae P10297]